MLGLPTWEGGIFICKSISGAHDDMTYFTFYKQSPERNVLHPRWKPYPLWRSRAPGPWLGTTPRWQRSPIINQVTPGFCKNQLGFETKGRSSPRRPPRHFLTLEPAKINPGVETRVRKILFKQLAAHFSRQSLRKTCGHASLNKAGRKFCPNVFLMVGFLWPGFSLHRLWVSP